MPKPAEPKRRNLTRGLVVARALEIADEEGLDAVSLRRLASDLGVTPMALYRHVRDKQDLINAMSDELMLEFDLTRGFRRSMTWSERLRKAMTNFKQQMEARPIALPLAIAYSGDNPMGFWRMTEDLLAILLDAGFPRRQAIVLIRVLSNLLSGYLLLQRQDDVPSAEGVTAAQVGLMRRRFELAQRALPEDDFPNLTSGAGDVADIWMSDPGRWWNDTLDLLVFGLERKLASTTKG